MNPDLLLYLSRAIVLLVALPIHETAHAYISYKLGDPTAKVMGRLSLNPLRHIDPMGALCMLATGIGWAKPVPIDPRYYRNRKGGMALSALAGPVSNLLLAYLSVIAYKISFYLLVAQAFDVSSFVISPSGIVYWLYQIFYMTALINISLCVFNFLPVPPLDGSRILGVVLPERIYFGLMRYERYVALALFALLWLGVLDRPLGLANDLLFRLLDVLSGFVDALMKTLVV